MPETKRSTLCIVSTIIRLTKNKVAGRFRDEAARHPPAALTLKEIRMTLRHSQWFPWSPFGMSLVVHSLTEI